jgi:hypothetical protein
MQFDLLTNPFAVLGLTGDASAGIITARARDLGTAAAASAGRTLLAPRTRLQAELCFLPGAGTLAGVCLDDLRAGREPDLWPLTPPARANVLAHLASGGTATASQLQNLVSLQDVIRSSVGEVIDRAREHAKMPPVPREMLDTALATLADQHGEAFANGMLALPDGADLFAEQLLATAPEAIARISFLRHSAAAWDRATASETARDLELATPIEATLQRNADPATAAQLAALVLRVAERSKPGREACRLVGLPHQASTDTTQRWRAVALDLNNRQDAVCEAVMVLDALADGFGTTDELGVLIAGDLDVCRKRLASAEGTYEARRLELAIKAAVENELAFQRSGIIDGRTTAQTPAVVAELYAAFMAATGLARSDTPWRLLRAFTLRLHNEFAATETALSFTQLAIERGTGTSVAADALFLLQLDLITLHKKLLNVELVAAVSTKQTSVAQRLLKQLIRLTDDANTRGNLQIVLGRLIKPETSTRIKYLLYAGIAVLPFIFFIISNGSPPASPGSTSYRTRANQVRSSGYPVSNPPPTQIPNSPMAIDPDAWHPAFQPFSNTTILTRAELRWCRYESARSNAAQDFLQANESNPAIDRGGYKAIKEALSAYIAFMNTACFGKMPQPADRSVIDFELTQNSAALIAEGQNMIVRWYQTANIPANKRTVVPADPTPGYVPPASKASPAYTSSTPAFPAVRDFAAFSQGQADRHKWESWFVGLSGAYRDGADWWVGVRASAHPPSCDRTAGMDHATAVSGCIAAKARLDNVDIRRRAEFDYRTGWNNP